VLRENIVRVLRETGGVLGGPRGAAARLGLKRTTLQSKMGKMGIFCEEFENRHRDKDSEN
jgi:formate hydrogenlyase transcriptional activator